MTIRRWTVPLSVAVVVTGVVFLAVWLARGGSSTTVKPSARPHVLHLVSANADATAMSATSTELTAPSKPYQLVGSLPAGTPDDQPLWRLQRATADAAQHVADALQLSGAPERVNGGWVLRHGDNRLVVRDDGSWSYGMDCAPDTPVSDEDVNVGCAATGGVAVESTDPIPVPSYPPGPSAADARAAAGQVFDRLGMTDPAVVVFTDDPTSTVQASPSVNGMTSSGWVTTVQIDGSGDVVTADGWLSSPERGADYPVITAQAAFDLLQLQPRPELMLCAQRPDGKPGCADIPPTEVTGAELGVMLDQDNGHPVLVPAWLFTISGQDDPVSQIAVDPSFLGPPPQPPAVEPAQPAPDEPMSVEPAPAGS
jgi:hypothetical protein